MAPDTDSDAPGPGRRILFVLRTYSGFEQSLADGIWRPRGVPTIYRLIEALDRQQGGQCQIILASRGGTSGQISADRDLRLAGLKMPVRVLAPPERFAKWLGRFRLYVSELANTWKVYRAARRLRPDLLYVDRGNLWVAGLLSRFTRWPVLYRVMGISDALVNASSGKRPVHVLERWLLRSRFAAIVCTQDGSGGERWLGKLFRRDVPVHLLLNGVDRPDGTAIPARRAAKVQVGFVGRLEDIKGCREFLEAFLRARALRPGTLHAVIVGEGPLSAALAERIAQAGAQDDVTSEGSLPHDAVQGIYPRLDVYVSLNRQGNLSNANLEAFSAGCCCVVPMGDPATGRDDALDRLFPSETLFRIRHPRDVEGLADAMIWLHDHPEERRDRGRRTGEVAAGHVPTWQARVSRELAIIDGIHASSAA